MLYAGIACMTPRVVNFSTLVGSILFFGILLPIIFSYGADVVGGPTAPIPDGYWFTRGKGINNYSEMGGYGVFFMICCVLGNGLYVVVDMTKVTIMSIIERKREKKDIIEKEDDRSLEEIREEHLRIKIMEDSTINKYFIASVFFGTIALGLVTIPFLFPIKWYMVLLAYIIFPLISVMNVYLFGLTDQAITFLLAKGLIFMVGSWFHSALGEKGSLPALMIFLDMGFSDSNYPVGYAPAYVGVGKIALEGFGALPKYATHIGAKRKNEALFMTSGLTLWLWGCLYAYLSPGDYVIPTMIGWLSCELWKYKGKLNASRYQSIVGAAIVVGVSIWGIPQTILSIAGIDSPMCLTAWPTLDGRLYEGSANLKSLL
eukprot:Pgem_evm1s11896